jgi:hypothetical protein
MDELILQLGVVICAGATLWRGALLKRLKQYVHEEHSVVWRREIGGQNWPHSLLGSFRFARFLRKLEAEGSGDEFIASMLRRLKMARWAIIVGLLFVVGAVLRSIQIALS